MIEGKEYLNQFLSYSILNMKKCSQ